MAEQSKPDNFPLQEEEINWVIRSFLAHPDRAEKGATTEEIIKVIEWAANIKIEALVKIGILYEIYAGNISLDLREGEVYMSEKRGIDDKVSREPLKYLNIETLLALTEKD